MKLESRHSNIMAKKTKKKPIEHVTKRHARFSIVSEDMDKKKKKKKRTKDI